MTDRPITLTSQELNQCIRDSHADTRAPGRGGDFLPDPLAKRGFVDIKAFERCTGQLRRGRINASLHIEAAQDVLAESKLDSQLLSALSNEGAGGKLDANDIGLLRDAFQARRIQIAGYREPMSDIELRGAIREAVAPVGREGPLTAERAREIAAHSWVHDPKQLANARRAAEVATARDIAERKARTYKAVDAAVALEREYEANVDEAQAKAGTNFTIADSLKDRLNNPSFHPQARLIIFQELGRANPPLDDTQQKSAVLTFINAIEGKSFDQAQATKAARDAIAGARRIHSEP